MWDKFGYFGSEFTPLTPRAGLGTCALVFLCEFSACRRQMMNGMFASGAWRTSCVYECGPFQVGTEELPCFSACRRPPGQSSTTSFIWNGRQSHCGDGCPFRTAAALCCSVDFTLTLYANLDSARFGTLVSLRLPLDLGLVQRQIWLAVDVVNDYHGHDALVDTSQKETGWLLQLFIGLQNLVIPFCRSFAAMILGALLRLLFYGMCLRGGQRNFDPMLRTARGVCRGASFAFLVTAFMLPVGMGVRTGLTDGGLPGCPNLVDPVLEAQFVALSDESARRVEHNAAIAPVPEYERAPPGPGGDGGVMAQDEVVRECRVAIRILMFQQMDKYATMWVSNDSTTEEIKDRVRRSMIQDQTAFTVCEAAPQLPDDVITVMVVPSWWSRMNKVGIIFDQIELGGEAFVAAVPAYCSLTDVYVAFGSPPPEGMGFYLQNAPVALPRRGRFHVAAGSVLRLRTTALQRIEVPYLADALLDLYWARDLNLHGLPAVDPPDDKALVIATEAARILDVSHEPTVPQLHRYACNALEIDPEQTAITLGRARVNNFTYNGATFDQLVALVPKDWLETTPRQIGVFLDARDFGEPISFHVFNTNKVHANDVVEALELTLPPGIAVKVSGTAGQPDADGRSLIVAGDVIVVWAEASDSDGPTEEDASTSSSSPTPDPWTRPFYVTAAIYARQRSVHFLRVSVIPEDDGDSLAAEIDETYYQGDHFRMLCPVQPQPNSGFVSVIAEMTWTNMQGLLPILIDLTAVGGRRFASFLGMEFSLDELIVAIGPEWRHDFVVFAEGVDTPLYRGFQYPALRGMLVSVVASGEERPNCRSLDHRLRHPQDWAATDHLLEFDEEALETHSSAILGRGFQTPIIRLPDLPHWVEIGEYVAGAIGFEEHEIAISVPARHVRDLSVRGRHVPSLLGVVFVDEASPFGIFIDARDLGMEVYFIQQHTCTAKLSALLDSAGVLRHPELRFQVQGAMAYSQTTDDVTYTHRAVLLVTVDTDSLPTQTSTDGGDGGDDLNGGGDDDVLRQRRSDVPEPPTNAADCGMAAARSRSPRRRSGNAAHGGGEVEAGGMFMWNLDSTQDANVVCLKEDTSDSLTGIYTLLESTPLEEKDSAMQEACELLNRLCPLEPQCQEGEMDKPVVATPNSHGCAVEMTMPLQVGGRRIATPCNRGGVQGPNSPAALTTGGTVISIADSIGPAAFDLGLECMTVMSRDNERALCLLGTPWDGFSLQRSLEGVQLKPATAHALPLCVGDVSGWNPNYLEVYTDGSAKDGNSGFAVAIFAQYNGDGLHQTAFLGYLAGKVVTDPNDACYLGADAQDAFQAEVSAMAWATLWALLTEWFFRCAELSFGLILWLLALARLVNGAQADPKLAKRLDISCGTVSTYGRLAASNGSTHLLTRITLGTSWWIHWLDWSCGTTLELFTCHVWTSACL